MKHNNRNAKAGDAAINAASEDSAMTLSRRALAASVGALAGGVGLLGPAMASGLIATPAQTEGPFYPVEPLGETDVDLTLLEGHSEAAEGEVILVRGRVLNAKGEPLAGAQVDIWQANAKGKYAHPDDPNPAPLDPNFQGIGITKTDADGWYGFKTIKPAAYKLGPEDDAPSRARHIHFKVAHADVSGLTTQMYFSGDPLLAEDIVMKNTPSELHHTVITNAEVDKESGLPLHRFDLVLT